jgi:hypothetical protein
MPSETLHQPSERFEELKLLQSIIARHEDYSFRAKGWFAAIVGALAAALYSKHIAVTRVEFVILTLVVYGALVIWLLYHRVIIRRAIGRVWEIENDSYRGLRIVQTLSPRVPAREMFSLNWDPQVHVPIILGFSILAIFYALVVSNAELGTTHSGSGGTGVATSAGEVDRSGDTGFTSSAAEVDRSNDDWAIGGSKSGGNFSFGRPDNTSPSRELPPPPRQLIGFDGLFVITILLILGVGLILLRGIVPKAAGILLLLSGLNIVVVKEFKFNIDNFIGSVSFGPKTPPPPVTEPQEPPRFGAQYLGGIEKFRLGHATMDGDGLEQLDAAMTEFDKICKGWQRRGDTENAMVLIVGATDRLPLAGANRRRYEANAGLALARASAMRNQLNDKCWTEPNKPPDPKNVILLVSGPRTTPDGRTGRPPQGFPDDRRVDVWALTGIPTGSIGTATAPTKRSQDGLSTRETAPWSGSTSSGNSID